MKQRSDFHEKISKLIGHLTQITWSGASLKGKQVFQSGRGVRKDALSFIDQRGIWLLRILVRMSPLPIRVNGDG